MTTPADPLVTPEAQARSVAEEKLRASGFTKVDEGVWTGELSGGGGETASLTVTLNSLFPHALPIVTLTSAPPVEARAHVAHGGTLCIAPSHVLLDVERADGIIEETLQRAQDILFPPDEAIHATDLAKEFTSYWPPQGAVDVSSICDLTGQQSPIVLTELKGGPTKYLFAPTKEIAAQWAEKLGATVQQVKPAYFVPLETLPPPPPYAAAVTLRELRHLVQTSASKDVNDAFTAWLKDEGVPSYVLFAAPGVDGGVVGFAASLPAPSSEQMKRAGHGFRKGHVPKALIVSRANSEPIVRLDLDRLDAPYLVERGGGDLQLLGKKVTLFGCGSIGSHAAESLHGSGVGELRLLDMESMAGANVHRHALGVHAVGQGKAQALAADLCRRFPHLTVTATELHAFRALTEVPTLLNESDLVILALGDETVERRLTALLPQTLPRVHVWLEPRGLGGHVLTAGFPHTHGCYECLFRRDDVYGITNMASLVESGQEFSRSLAGCAGTFTPYGILDAQRAAIEAVRMSLDILRGTLTAPMLRTWMSSRRSFEDGAFRLSQRGTQMTEGQMLTVTDFARPDCPRCGGPIA